MGGRDWESGDQGLLQVSHGSEGRAWGCPQGFLQQKFLWVLSVGAQKSLGPAAAASAVPALLLLATATGFSQGVPFPTLSHEPQT